MAKQTPDQALLQKISNEIKKSNETNEKIHESVSETSDIAQKEEQTSFLQEQRFDLEINIMKEQNSLLSGILEKIDEGSSTEQKEKKTGLSGLFGKLFGGMKLGFLTKFLPKSFLGLFKPLFQKMFSKKGLLGLGKKLIKFIGAPITAILAGIDFFKGWKEAEGPISEKIQSAMSNVLSGLTFGLVDSDIINKGFHKVNDFIFNNVTVPVMDFIMNFPERITEMFSNIDLSFLDTFMNIPLIADIIDKVKTAIDNTKQRITEYIINPIQSFATSALESFTVMFENLKAFLMKIKEIVLAPLEMAQGFLGDVKDKFSNFKEKFSFGNMFESDQEKAMRKDIETKSVETLNKTEQKTESTTNNNILTNNNRTVINDSVDMSVRSDDLVNMNPSFNF